MRDVEAHPLELRPVDGRVGESCRKMHARKHASRLLLHPLAKGRPDPSPRTHIINDYSSPAYLTRLKAVAPATHVGYLLYCMLFVSASVLRSQDMATLQEKVDAALARKGMTATELGSSLGYKHGYQGYYALFVTQKIALTPERKARIVQILDVDPDYFDDGNEAEARARRTRYEFEQFLQDPVVRHCEDHIIRTLERMTFAGGRVPTRQLYRLLALVMMGFWDDKQVTAALKLNAELDELPPVPEPPSGKPPGKKGRKARKSKGRD